ncbi:glycosyltransferase [Ktedonobacter sp. SOSP1-85]|uniref:glycosyltransferase n=1 Tax=Ktedonobacter sp. SOSP1-85 TaxID=2778367 RepID=UPI0019162280|nr:glycosyltransferase [Ktedonobacter sp. SOSP1-85]
MRKTPFWKQSWPRRLLWSHAIAVAGFYMINWWRTRPRESDQVESLSVAARARVSDLPLVSIIVPARDEEHNIQRCVESLLGQDYGNFEVIVVNDDSQDRTGEILQAIQQQHPHGDLLRVVEVKELPTGWAGKPHAMHQGALAARGAWLVFSDADTCHAPQALRSAFARAQEECADLFSMGAEQELPTFWERVLIPIAYMGISMLYPPRQVNDPNNPLAIAAGQFMLIRREVYEHIGGYAAPHLRATVLDDLDLARTVKAQGYRTRFLDGRGLVFVRMYRNFGEIWRGWLKNAYLGNRGGLPFLVVQLVGLFNVCIVPFLLPLLFFARIKGLSKRDITRATALELWALLSYRFWLNRKLGLPRWQALTHPLGAAIFEGILARSAWLVLSRKGVQWRGRTYHGAEE